MIKANELRLDNWILLEKNGIKTPYCISEGHDFDEIESDGSDCFGVPLTPEILEKVGFIPDDNPIYTTYFLNISFGLRREFVVKSFYGHIVNDNSECIVHYSANSHTCSRPYKYVHELQNAYRALTGEELTINL